jgi:hypothetical protein
VIEFPFEPRSEQLLAWPVAKQLCLPEQLALLVPPPDRPPDPDDVPRGVELLEPPDARAALECVRTVLTEAANTLRTPVPRVNWFRPIEGPDTEGQYELLNGFVRHGGRVVWLYVGYRSPQRLAVTTAHEAVHYWQNYRRGPCLDDVEHSEREGEAQRRADLLVPKGTYRTPRGKKRDPWFEPARRRYRAENVTPSAVDPLDIAAEAVTSGLR